MSNIYVTSKAKTITGMLYRQFYNDVSPDVLLTLYTATVRPHMVPKSGTLT